MFYPIEKAKGLNDLKDTSIVTPVDGQAPVYNGTTQKWENKLVVTQAEQNVLGSKNILYHTFTDRTSDSVTYQVNADRSIKATITGTHSSDTNMPITNDWNGFDISAYIGKTLICSGGQGSGSTFGLNFQIVDSSGNFITYMPNEEEYTVPNNAKYCIPIMGITSAAMMGDSYTYHPMLRLKGTDSTYVPYAPTNQDLAYVRDGWKKNGAYNYASLYYNSNQYVNGITFYFQNDGTIYYVGTAEQDVYFRISYDIKVSKTGLYKLTGVPKNATNTVLYPFTEAEGNIQFRDLGSGGMGVLEAGVSYGIYLLIGSGTAVSNTLVLKPMLTSDLNADYDDFVKPAKTNLELTADIDDLQLTTVSYNLQSTGLTATTTTGQITAFGMNVMLDKKGNIYRMAGRVVLSGTEANVRPNIEIKHSTFASMKGYWSISGPSLRGSGSTYVACDGCDISHANGSNVISISQNNTLTSGPAGYFTIYFNS